MAIHVTRTSEHDLPPPAAASDLAAGMDLRACLFPSQKNAGVMICPGGTMLIQTGWAIEIPDGMAGLVTPRSGLALKNCITVLNAPGLIDPDYRGEIGVILHNAGILPFKVRHGDRIAQLVIVPCFSVGLACEVVGALEDTERAAGGFGSTGTK